MSESPQFAAFRKRFEHAQDQALLACAHVYRGAVMKRLSKGYTTGDHVTGNVMNSVTIAKPETVDGLRRVVVGTNVKYAAYWEFGWRPSLTTTIGPARTIGGRGSKQGRGERAKTFTRQGPQRYFRVEHWRLAMEEVMPTMRTTFEGVFWRTLRGT